MKNNNNSIEQKVVYTVYNILKLEEPALSAIECKIFVSLSHLFHEKHETVKQHF
jgi:hypothetical protein